MIEFRADSAFATKVWFDWFIGVSVLGWDWARLGVILSNLVFKIFSDDNFDPGDGVFLFEDEDDEENDKVGEHKRFLFGNWFGEIASLRGDSTDLPVLSFFDFSVKWTVVEDSEATLA